MEEYPTCKTCDMWRGDNALSEMLPAGWGFCNMGNGVTPHATEHGTPEDFGCIEHSELTDSEE